MPDRIIFVIVIGIYRVGGDFSKRPLQSIRFIVVVGKKGLSEVKKRRTAIINFYISERVCRRKV